MENFFYILPFVAAALVGNFYGFDNTVEMLIAMIGCTCLVIWQGRRLLKRGLCATKEYLGGWITAVRHYDEWDEWIHHVVTETRRDAQGKTYTVQVDRSYRKYHPEYWVYLDTFRREVTISRSYYNQLSLQFGTEQRFIPMHRHYYRINGDAQQYNYAGEESKCRILTVEGSYQNPLRCTNNIYKFEKFTPSEVMKLGLYDYPLLRDEDQSPLLGATEEEATDERRLRFLNAVLGHKYEFRNYLLFFHGKSAEIAELQKAYWQGGNKNEFVVCLGMSDHLKVEWCRAFSWMDSPELEVRLRQWFTENDQFNMQEYSQWLLTNVPLYWKRKHFSDFNYIRVKLGLGRQIFLLTLALAVIGFFWYLIERQLG